MIRKILLVASVYATLTIAATLTLSQEKSFVSALMILNIGFAAIVIMMIYKHIALSRKHDSQDMHKYLNPDRMAGTNGNFNEDTVSRISKSTFLFGLEKGLASPLDFYYDQDFFYAVGDDGTSWTYRLTNIAELKGTATQINNSRIWQVKIVRETETIEYLFAHNFSIWNRNFLNFYKRLKHIRPDAVKSEWSFWRM